MHIKMKRKRTPGESSSSSPPIKQSRQQQPSQGGIVRKRKRSLSPKQIIAVKRRKRQATEPEPSVITGSIPIEDFVENFNNSIPQSKRHILQLELGVEEEDYGREQLLKFKLKAKCTVYFHEKNKRFWEYLGLNHGQIGKTIKSTFKIINPQSNIIQNQDLSIVLQEFDRDQTVSVQVTVFDDPKKFTIEDGCYFDPNDFLKKFNEHDNQTTFMNHVSLRVAPNKIVYLRCDLNYEIRFGTVLGNLLGFDSGRWLKGTIPSRKLFTLDNGINALFIYCSIVQFQMVGDHSVPLLREVVPRNKSEKNSSTDSNYYTFERAHYLNLNSTQFNEIEVQVASQDGRDIEFIPGITLLKLHFIPTA